MPDKFYPKSRTRRGLPRVLGIIMEAGQETGLTLIMQILESVLLDDNFRRMADYRQFDREGGFATEAIARSDRGRVCIRIGHSSRDTSIGRNPGVAHCFHPIPGEES